MALIFGRFDKAPEAVREAMIELSVKGVGDLSDYIPPARTVFQQALDLAPDATASDLSHVVSVLVREGQHLGFIGPHCRPETARARFEAFIYQRWKPGYRPSDGERYITLAEMSVLMLAQKGSERPFGSQRC
jgi:hypothetical protein